jgi:phospholipid/cholesterol/gamma-HCH transport system ATP-binding protein
MPAPLAIHSESPAGGAEVLLEVEALSKGFGGRPVLRGITFAVSRGSVFTLLGPSGAGKSVLLKCIAGVAQPDTGRIRFDGRLLDFSNRSVRNDFRQRCSFLFQGNALFDSLTALQNVALPLEQTTSLPRAEVRDRACEALAQLELHDYRDHYPSTLSGGMQKRLALARAIVTRPSMVFFDEPTAGLDPLRRNAVFAMIAKYQSLFGFTALIVTHDVVEAMVVSDTVALLYHGEIPFSGTPGEFATSTHPVVHAFRDSAHDLRSTLAAVRRGEDITAEEEDS